MGLDWMPRVKEMRGDSSTDVNMDSQSNNKPTEFINEPYDMEETQMTQIGLKKDLSSTPVASLSGDDLMTAGKECVSRIQSSLAGCKTDLAAATGCMDLERRKQLFREQALRIQSSEEDLKRATEITKELGSERFNGDKAVRACQNFLATKLKSSAEELWNIRSEAQQGLQNTIKQSARASFLVRTGTNLTEDAMNQVVSELGSLQGPGDHKTIDQRLRQTIGNIAHFQVLVDIAEETLRDVRLIEREIADLERLFLDLHLLVMEQGDLLNDIMTEVNKVNKLVEQGNEELHKAVKAHKKIRRKHWIIILCIVGIAITVAIGVGVPVALMKQG